nr:trissin receptor-like [Procambarus clarkii]
MYQFVNQLSYTASVIILVVVSGERYLAIVEPLRAKTLLTRKNMIVTMILVWIFSALYSCPRLLYFTVQEYPVEGGGTEAMCLLRRDQFDTRIWDVVSLTLLYLLPLVLLSLLYARIAHTLWRSGRLLAAATSPHYTSAELAAAEYGTFKTQHTASVSSTSSSAAGGAGVEGGGGGGTPTNTPARDKSLRVTRGSVKSIMSTYVSMASVRDEGSRGNNHSAPDVIPLTPLGSSRRSRRGASPRVRRRALHLHPSPLVLRARRKVINMLVVVVVSFAACSLPFHTRKMLQYYWTAYNHTSHASYLLTPVTFLLMYANSAVNPILYTFMSRKFRTSSCDLLTCRLRQTRRARPQRPTVVARLSGRDKVVTHLV